MRLGRDDHNNPSLVFRRDGHLVVFFSPHSGRRLREHQIGRMRYRTGLNRYSIDKWGPVHTVDTNVPCGLGYTYPNPIQQRDQLWLFRRGGNWNPTFSYMRNLRDWVPTRELLTSARGSGRTRSSPRRQDPHPRDLHRRPPEQLEYEPALRALGALYTASGRKLGSFRNLPIHTSKLDHIYRYTDQGGRAWVHDIALDADGKPYIVYTRRHTASATPSRTDTSTARGG